MQKKAELKSLKTQLQPIQTGKIQLSAPVVSRLQTALQKAVTTKLKC